jgi:hypothetical protein
VRLLLAAALALGIASVPVEQAMACSCMQLDVDEAAGLADAVFAGTVIDERPVAVGDGSIGAVAATVPMPAPLGQVIYTFKVEGVGKGDVGALVDILGGGDGASCGMSFAVGDRWLVFATWDGAMMTTTLCSGNMQLAPDEEPPLPLSAPIDGGAAEEPPAEVPWAMVGVLGAVALLIGVSWFAFRREGASPAG